MQFVCLLSCLRPCFVVQINNIFRLVLFAAITNKRRGERQISKTIKYKLDSSSKMQFVFFYPKNIQKYFLENYQFYRKCGNDAKSRGVGGGVMFLSYYDALRTKIVIWSTPNSQESEKARKTSLTFFCFYC